MLLQRLLMIKQNVKDNDRPPVFGLIPQLITVQL